MAPTEPYLWDDGALITAHIWVTRLGDRVTQHTQDVTQQTPNTQARALSMILTSTQ